MNGVAPRPLGEIAQIIRGITFKPDDVIDPSTPNAIGCMRTKNVQAELDQSDVWGVDRAHLKREEQFLREGDVLISSANSWNLVGKCCWIPELSYASTFGGFVSAVRPRPQLVDARYLYRYISSVRTQTMLRSYARQTTNIANLDLKRAATLPVPLPPLPEQRRIAAILDHADALRIKRRESLDHLDELARSIFKFSFDGTHSDTRKLSDVVKRGTIVTYGIVQAGDEFPDGVPYVRTGDIDNGKIKVETLRRTDPAIAAKFKRSTLEEGDIVMSIRATVGTTAMADKSLAGANLTQGTARISPGIAVNGEFLLHLLRSERSQGWIARQVKGATFREITLGRLRELPVMVPPISTQNTFASRLQRLQMTREAVEHDLSRLDELFSALQVRAFRGEL